MRGSLCVLLLAVGWQSTGMSTMRAMVVVIGGQLVIRVAMSVGVFVGLAWA